MTKGNICPFCQYSTPQKNTGLGSVDCLFKGYRNAAAFECEHYKENERPAKLKREAVAAIQDYEAAKDTKRGKLCCQVLHITGGYGYNAGHLL